MTFRIECSTCGKTGEPASGPIAGTLYVEACDPRWVEDPCWGAWHVSEMRQV